MTSQELEKIRASVDDALAKIRAHADLIESSLATVNDAAALARMRRIQDALSEASDELSP